MGDVGRLTVERDMSDDVVSVERVIPAPPERIFELVSDPAKHTTFDGSGTVKDSTDQSDSPLKLGSTFGMNMKMGAAYTMVNTIVELEPNRRIAWQAHKGTNPILKKFTGRIWRYELEPVDGGTKVTESWDVSRDGLGWLLKRTAADKTRENMTRTLERIEKALA